MYLSSPLFLTASNSRYIHKNISLFMKKFSALSQNFTTSSILKQSSRQKKSNLGIKKHIGIGIGLCSMAAGGYMYFYNKRRFSTLDSLHSNEYFLMELPPVQEITTFVEVPEGPRGLKITLYQYQTCPFCSKVRAFLNYFGFSYSVVEVNPLTQKQIKWSSHRKVPFLVIEREGSQKIMILKESSMIISVLQSYLKNKTETLEELVKGYKTISYSSDDRVIKTDIMNKYFILYGEQPPGITTEQIISERRWRKWVDDVYVHLVSPNVYRTMNESLQTFSWLSKAGNWEGLLGTWERLLVTYVGFVAMYVIAKRLKKRYNLKNDVRQSLYEETNVWLKEVKTQGGNFAGGEEPNLSDVSLYGVLTAIEGCGAFQDLMNNTELQPWFDRMRYAVETRQGVKFVA